jgi:hypothetical protein
MSILTGTQHPYYERESRGRAWLWSGNQSHQNVARQIQQRIIAREQPGHPLPFTLPPQLAAIPAVSPVQRRTIGQEYPWHPGALTRGPQLAPVPPVSSVVRTMTVRQELPPSPVPQIFPGVPPVAGVTPPTQPPIYSLVAASLSAASATGIGSTVFFGVPKPIIGLQISTTGSPTTFNVNLEGTIDGTNYFTAYTVTQATSGSVAGGAAPPPVIGARANLTAFSGGTAPTFTATVSGA